MPFKRVLRISHLREILGFAYKVVVETDEPIIVQRYSRQDVALVPLWEWRFLKELEERVKAGDFLGREVLGDGADFEATWLDDGRESR
ncbi:hypothetical protein CA54_61220 [Symmachiella macrocystis]|uniref:Phd_YefM n=1 Tax=Symmachiella macrocystis TaxID=2527985 RepID=A0A5C6ATX0_9PLAN|nr:hypothetical protein [Symmachiella macrocystis]TWU03038.1 hypothetical protein CA54_61220 [Symmachiella macrocystis]